MRLDTFHRVSMTAAIALPTAGVMGGSGLLAGAGGALLLVVLGTGGRMLMPERSKALTTVVHVATLLLLVGALATFPRSRVDAVLCVVMLGIFNRFVLRGGLRDDLVMLGASGVLLAAATTITPGILFLPIVLGFIISALWATWGATVLGLGEPSAENDGALMARLAARDESRPVLRIALLAILFTVGGAFSTLMFPRYHFGRIFSAGYFMSMPGQSNEMELTTGGVSQLGGGAIVLRVEPVHDQSVALEGLYAQTGVLDRFDGKTWRVEQNRDFGSFFYAPWERRRPDPANPTLAQVVMFRRAPRSEPHPVALIGHDRPAKVHAAFLRQTAAGAPVRPWGSAGTQFEYLVDMGTTGRRLALHGHADRFLQLPEKIDPRVTALAERLTAGLSGDREKVRAVLRHFDAGYVYSLEPLPGEAEDPLVRFLFEAKQGHCELYAGAVATLLRLSGIRARVATGYYGGWWNDVGGYLEMAEGDAHAWVDVNIDGQWVWVDATPGDLRARRKEKGFAFLLDLYDALEAAWHNHVLSFGQRERQRMVADLKSGFQTFSTDLRDVAEKAREGRAADTSYALWTAVILGLGFLLLILFSLRRLLVRKRDPQTLGRRLRRTLRAEDNLTLRAALAALPEGRKAAAERAVDAYEALRFGPEEDAPSAALVTDAIRDLERTARR